MNNSNQKVSNMRISNDEKLGFVSSLATMFSAGIPLLETIDSLLEYSKGNQKKMLLMIMDDVSQGKQLNMALAKFPKIFDKVTINIIKASEEAGTLDVALKDLKENIKKSAEFKDKIRAALIYPILIVVVFTGVLLMMLLFVIPRISEVFSRLNADLPLPTVILIGTSNFMIDNAIPFWGAVAGIIGLFVYLFRTRKKLVMHVITSVPPFSTLALQIDLTQFTHSLYLLLNAGINITSALELTQEVVIQKKTSQAIEHTKDMITSGKTFSQGLKDKTDIFPPLMVKIVEAGEKSGNLENSLQDASEFLDYQVSKSLKTVTLLLEPVMLVVIGIMVGGMMLAIIAPIYGVIGQVGTR
jgi:type II secretory pathway component PulF